MKKEEIKAIFKYWKKTLRLENNWEIKLELINDSKYNKTGDFKVDPDDKKAILLINELNPHRQNLEEVIVHELMHLKLYPLDQVTEGLIESHYKKGTNKHNFVYSQFMLTLEQTVEELTKCFLIAFGRNKNLSYGRVKSNLSFNDLYKGLKIYGYDK